MVRWRICKKTFMFDLITKIIRNVLLILSIVKGKLQGPYNFQVSSLK